jgi:hypothetical protein
MQVVRRATRGFVTRPTRIDTAEIIDTVHNRRAPMISASAGLSI